MSCFSNHKYHGFESDQCVIRSFSGFTHLLAGCYGVVTQILTLICAFNTSASCLRLSRSPAPWLWFCCILNRFLVESCAESYKANWAQSSANACSRFQSFQTPLIQNHRRPRKLHVLFKRRPQLSFVENPVYNM